MKKRKIIVKKAPGMLNFYLMADGRAYYLFAQRFNLRVYKYFCHSITENEVLTFRGWHKNALIDHIMEKLPMYIRYADKELIPACTAEKLPKYAARSKAFRVERMRMADAYEYAA